MKKYLIVTFMIVLLASSAWSFDDDRKGFILGGGLGYAPPAKWETGDTNYVVTTNDGLGLNFIIGIASEQNMFVYEENVTIYKSINYDDLIIQGFQGATWYHYFSPSKRTLFTALGIGSYGAEGNDLLKFSKGLGFLFGIGFEFSKHRQIGIYYSSGKTSRSNYENKLNHVNFLFTLVAF